MINPKLIHQAEKVVTIIKIMITMIIKK